MTHPDEVAVGEVVANKYRILGPLGAGGMGTVYRAEHLRVGQHVAVKVLSERFAGVPEFAARFEREARIAGRLKSLHTVRVHDVDNLPSGAPFMVMELLDGHDLRVEAQRGGIATGDLVAWAIQVCSALAEAHEHGIVHRDIKPANVFLARVDRTRIAKVVDFGISKPMNEGNRLTQGGDALGTPQYMSPEQLHAAADIDGRADIFALGVLLYKILSGKYPLEPMELIAWASNVGPAPLPLEVHRPDLPRPLCAAIMKALERDREQRHASADAIAEALRPHSRESARFIVTGPASSPAVPDALSPTTRIAHAVDASSTMPHSPAGPSTHVMRVQPPPPSVVPSVTPSPAGSSGWIGAALVVMLLLGAGGAVLVHRSLGARRAAQPLVSSSAPVAVVSGELPPESPPPAVSAPPPTPPPSASAAVSVNPPASKPVVRSRPSAAPAAPSSPSAPFRL